MDTNTNNDTENETNILDIPSLSGSLESCKISQSISHTISHTMSQSIDEYTERIEKCIHLGVPNMYCSQHFDDEDFIYNKLLLPDVITSYYTSFGCTFPEYVFDYIVKNKICIDFSKVDHNVYQKTLYIYQYVLQFQSEYISKADKHNFIQYDLFNWVSNLISCIKSFININPTSIAYIDMSSWYKELLYGIIVTSTHLKMLIKCKDRGIYYSNIAEQRVDHQVDHQAYQQTEQYAQFKYINKFYRVLNNLCVILIYFKVTYGGFE